MLTKICLTGALILYGALPTVSNPIAPVDLVAPAIEITENPVDYIAGNDFQIRDYVSVSDNSDQYRLLSISDDSVEDEGKHTIHLIAVDKSGNTSTADLIVNTISEETYQGILEKLDYYSNTQYELNNELISLKGDGTDTDAYSLALSFLGMGGSCDYVAQQFIYSYLGSYSIYDTYDVNAYEVEPGDVIFYTNGGLGVQHWAVYLGGNLALQGNYNGTTVITSVYLDGASEPQFRRINQ